MFVFICLCLYVYPSAFHCVLKCVECDSDSYTDRDTDTDKAIDTNGNTATDEQNGMTQIQIQLHIRGCVLFSSVVKDDKEKFIINNIQKLILLMNYTIINIKV